RRTPSVWASCSARPRRLADAPTRRSRANGRPNLTPRRSLLPIALVFSGGAALGVEVLWQRFLSRLLGGSTMAPPAVLMAYMGGLALGAGLAGRRGDRVSPAGALRGYVRLELAVWLAASLTTLLLSVLPVGIGGVLAALPEGGPRFLARFVVAAL